MITFLKPPIFLLLLLLFSSTEKQQAVTLPKDFTAKVIAVKDGDTIEVLYNEKPLTIRFAHIDCPEIKKGQPFGKAAKQFTSELCFGQFVTILHESKYDRYKRLIAVVINDKGKNVNKELVMHGLAWHFLKYSTDASYDVLEATARNNKTGLWADANSIPPWKWRKP